MYIRMYYHGLQCFKMYNIYTTIECARKGCCCYILHRFSWVIHDFRSHFNLSGPDRKSETKCLTFKCIFFPQHRKSHTLLEHTDSSHRALGRFFFGGGLVGLSYYIPLVNSLASMHEYFVLQLWAVSCGLWAVGCGIYIFCHLDKLISKQAVISDKDKTTE